jgi:hypothetical protein
VFIDGYYISGYWCVLYIMVIGEYFVIGYCWLLMVIVLMVLGGSFINGYW